MKTKTLHKESVNIITMGCSKNLVDSENMLTQLRGNDIAAEHESKNESDVVIINTCGFIDNAKEESVNTILDYVGLKEEGKVKKVYVTGCLSERYREDLQKEIPSVDAFFGTLELPLLLKKFNADYKHELVGERITTTANHYAYMKIAEGCDRPCSFCAIPLMRGKHVSRPIDELVLEAKNLVRNGTKEIMLIAQDLTFYGLDIYKKRELSTLLRRLSDVEGLEWIRLHYAYPAGFPMDVIDVMAERDNICNYLDIPLQHGSSEVLKSMRRGIDRDKTEQLIRDVRAKIPNISIRTTLIAGYPGETEAHYEEMVQFVQDMKFDRLGVFTYSHEENTHAHTLEDDVPEEVKQERANEIMEIQQGIAFENNQKLIGQELKVLFDRKEGGNFIGRTEFDSPEVDNEVLVAAEEVYIPLGSFQMVKITDCSEFDLYGELVK
jgi:ribosomal protein S12 methylthiotransferase